MFGQNLEVQLSSARTKDTTVVWKSFHDRSKAGAWGGYGAWVIAHVEEDLRGLPAVPLAVGSLTS